MLQNNFPNVFTGGGATKGSEIEVSSGSKKASFSQPADQQSQPANDSQLVSWSVGQFGIIHSTSLTSAGPHCVAAGASASRRRRAA